MKNKREIRRKKATLEKARSDPAALYDQEYYASGYSSETELGYGRHGHWLRFFGRVARYIDRRYAPKTVIDIGCAFGLLVEALCDRGIDARGIDISPYAVSNARHDMKNRISVGSILSPIPLEGGRKYDLVVCVEVLEHLPPEQAEQAIDNLCAASDRILFSSSPDDFDEPTHFNVLETETWLAKFEQRGFVPAHTHLAKYLAPQARVVERPGTKLPLSARINGWFRR